MNTETVQRIPSSTLSRSSDITSQTQTQQSLKSFDNNVTNKVYPGFENLNIVNVVMEQPAPKKYGLVEVEEKLTEEEQQYSEESHQLVIKYWDILSSSWTVAQDIRIQLERDLVRFNLSENDFKFSFYDAAADFAKVSWEVNAARESLDSLDLGLIELESIEVQRSEEVIEEISSIEEERQYRVSKGVNMETFDLYHSINRELLGFNWWNQKWSDFPKDLIREEEIKSVNSQSDNKDTEEIEKSQPQSTAGKIFSAIGGGMSALVHLPGKLFSKLHLSKSQDDDVEVVKDNSDISSMESSEIERQNRINTKVDAIVDLRKQQMERELLSIKSL